MFVYTCVDKYSFLRYIFVKWKKWEIIKTIRQPYAFRSVTLGGFLVFIHARFDAQSNARNSSISSYATDIKFLFLRS